MGQNNGNAPLYILGISAFYHDSAACLVCEGRIVAAAQEERFTRKKHDAAFPRHAVAYCLREAGIGIDAVAYVGFYDKPILKFERLLLTYLTYAPWGIQSFLKAMPVWLNQKLFLPDLIRQELGYQGEILFTEHHEAHAASAFYPSPFKQAAILTIDGVGEWATTSYGVGRNQDLELNAEMQFPHSLGLLYSAFTYYVGFRVNSGEYKLMGLAPYGEPKYVSQIKKYLIDIKADGSFRLNMAYFNYGAGLTMTSRRFHNLFGGAPREPESALTQRYMDLARSIQEVTEEVMLKMARHVHHVTGQEYLCLAGGVALNCVGNGRILREGPFKRVWIQPAAGDAGGALGVALFIWHRYLNQARHADDQGDQQQGSLLGPQYDHQDVLGLKEKYGAVAEELSAEAMPVRVAQCVYEQHVVGVFQGRMEFGPRALGARSIIGDARSERMQSTMNLKIKFRESFRPFAPSVIEEKAAEYFDLQTKSPYMLMVASVAQDKIDHASYHLGNAGLEKLKVRRSEIPAVTHVDYSARVQTVSATTQPFFYAILKAFEGLSGCPVLINTSFNVRGEPIVCTPEDAYRCFMCTDMDYLVINNWIFEKMRQPNRHAFKKEDITLVMD